MKKKFDIADDDSNNIINQDKNILQSTKTSSIDVWDSNKNINYSQQSSGRTQIRDIYQTNIPLIPQIQQNQLIQNQSNLRPFWESLNQNQDRFHIQDSLNLQLNDTSTSSYSQIPTSINSSLFPFNNSTLSASFVDVATKMSQDQMNMVDNLIRKDRQRSAQPLSTFGISNASPINISYLFNQNSSRSNNPIGLLNTTENNPSNKNPGVEDYARYVQQKTGMPKFYNRDVISSAITPAPTTTSSSSLPTLFPGFLPIKNFEEQQKFIQQRRYQSLSEPQLIFNPILVSSPGSLVRSFSDTIDDNQKPFKPSQEQTTPTTTRTNLKRALKTTRDSSLDSTSSYIPTDDANDNDDEETSNASNIDDLVVSSTTHKKARRGGRTTSNPIRVGKRISSSSSPRSEIVSPLYVPLTGAESTAIANASFSSPNAPPKFWTPEEDEALIAAVKRNGPRNWKIIASYVSGRNPTQCQQRWSKVLVPGLRKGPWSLAEDNMLLSLAMEQINSQRMAQLNNSQKLEDSSSVTSSLAAVSNLSSYRINWKPISEKIPGRTAKQCRARWVNNLNPDLKKEKWTEEEDNKILALHETVGSRWSFIASQLNGRSENAVKIRFISLSRSKNNKSPINTSSTSSLAEQ